MQTSKPDQAGKLEFLQPYISESEIFSLPSGEQISIQKYFLRFDPWRGAKLEFDFGQKPVLESEGEACFAELAILRMFLKNGWNGAWVETYGGAHFLRSMPRTWTLKSEHIEIPAEKEDLLKQIWKAGDTRACFDVVVWRGGDVLFCEAKRLKKDRLTEAQKRFIQGALACGVSLSQLLIIEWDLASSKLEFEYPEDKRFFADLLAGGDEVRLEREFANRFDFRHPAIKREEFNKIRKQVLRDLFKKYGEACQLRIHPDCSKVTVWEPDHIIPLSTNELNKQLRHMARMSSAKVARQSFGSNHPDNLTLACKRCNAFKKHRLLSL